jgi:ankyrin repeat protein
MHFFKNKIFAILWVSLFISNFIQSMEMNSRWYKKALATEKNVIPLNEESISESQTTDWDELNKIKQIILHPIDIDDELNEIKETINLLVNNYFLLSDNNKQPLRTLYSNFISRIISNIDTAIFSLVEDALNKRETSAEISFKRVNFLIQLIDSLLVNFADRKSTSNTAVCYRDLKDIIATIAKRFIPSFNDKTYVIPRIHELRLAQIYGKSDIHTASELNPSILHTAIELEDTEWLRKFIPKYKKEINTIDHLGQTPLMAAIKRQYWNFAKKNEIISQLLAYDANPNNDMVEIPNSALTIAVSNRDRKSAQLLLDHGADRNPQSFTNPEEQETPPLRIPPLRIAIRNNDIEMVKLLLGYSEKDYEEINLNPNGNSLVEYAKQKGYTEIVKLLEDYQIYKDIPSIYQTTKLQLKESGVISNNFSILHVAADLGGLQWLKRKISDYKDEINHFNHRELTPLMIATMKDNAEIVEFLLSHGANPNLKSSNTSCSCLTIATYKNYRKIVALLLKHKANPNLYGSLPALRGAVKNNNSYLTKLLLAHKADPNISMKDQPLVEYAKEKGYYEIATLLEDAILR